METQIFTWESWENLFESYAMYYKVKLVVDVGNYKAGTSFDSANVNYGKSPYIAFFDDDGDLVAKFALSLTIGDAIPA